MATVTWYFGHWMSTLLPELTLDDLHLNGRGYSILSEALKRASGL
nr:hypothetical protein [Bacteroides finegoldii]